MSISLLDIAKRKNPIIIPSFVDLDRLWGELLFLNGQGPWNKRWGKIPIEGLIVRDRNKHMLKLDA